MALTCSRRFGAGGRNRFRSTEPEVLDEVAPFGQEFPGLAPTPEGGVDEAAPDAVAASMTGRLGLVPATRPADVIATLGWQGPTNSCDDVGPFAAVLRTWEDRFGAEVVGIGFDTLTLGVRRPPSSNEEATAVAAEHYAVCMDNISQGAGSIRPYAAELKGAGRWDFWWN